MQAPKYLVHIINSYLSNRRFKVFVKNVPSNIKNIVAGIVQGSLLGPKLYILYTHDLPKIKNVNCGLFADDTVNYCTSWRIDTIVSRLQAIAKKQLKYFEKWKIKINVNKTEAIIFTRRRPELPATINVFNQELPWSSSVKYLGVHLDSRLTFTPHINKIREKYFIALKIIYPIFNKKSKLNLKNKSLLYKSCLRPVLTYAAPVWGNTCQTNMKKLQVLQNIGLRIIGNYPHYTRIKYLHEQLNYEYIQKFIDRLTKKFFESSSQTNNILLNRMLTSDTSKYKKYMYKRVKHRYKLLQAGGALG